MGKLRKNNLADKNNDSSKSPPVVGKILRSRRKNLLHFPNEILLKIFQNYKIGHELNIRKVCSRFRDTYDHALVQKFDLFISKIKQKSNITKELHLSCQAIHISTWAYRFDDKALTFIKCMGSFFSKIIECNADDDDNQAPGYQLFLLKFYKLAEERLCCQQLNRIIFVATFMSLLKKLSHHEKESSISSVDDDRNVSKTITYNLERCWIAVVYTDKGQPSLSFANDRHSLLVIFGEMLYSAYLLEDLNKFGEFNNKLIRYGRLNNDRSTSKSSPKLKLSCTFIGSQQAVELLSTIVEQQDCARFSENSLNLQFTICLKCTGAWKYQAIQSQHTFKF